jgi:nitrogenase-stabilizing/protective protein
MTPSLNDFDRLTTAEEYLDFFQIPYDPKIVNVNRLHILQKFSQNISEINNNFPSLTETEKLDRYQTALTEAYEIFLTKSSIETKLFKVFNQKPQNIVMLNDIH